MGYAKKLLLSIEALLYNEIYCYELNVANCYAPAVKLYKTLGYKTYKIVDHTPGTYYFLEMRKVLHPHKQSNGKRMLSLIKSEFKFWILFNRHSNPTWIFKLLHK